MSDETKPGDAPPPVAEVEGADAAAAATTADDAATQPPAANADKDLPPPAPPLRYGVKLRTARERMGLRAGHIASTLHLEERVVRALEEGREDDLPARVYARGYIRAYANLVGLSPADLVADFDQNDDQPAEQGVGRPHPPRPPRQRKNLTDLPRRRPGLLFSGIVVVVVIALAGTLWAIQSAFDWSFVTNVGGPPAAQPAWRSGQNSERGSDDEAAEGGDRGEGGVSTTSAAAGAGQDIPTANLEFVIRADSWVEVYDGQKRALHEAVGKAGETLSMSGTPPFTIDIGYAAGVELRYNGDLVALAPHTQGSVAQLVLH